MNVLFEQSYEKRINFTVTADWKEWKQKVE